MGKVVNLRRARKAKARRDKDAQADVNRRQHGQTRAEKRAQADAKARLARTVDGARREGPPTDPVKTLDEAKVRSVDGEPEPS